MAVDNISIYNKLSELAGKCDSCGSQDHQTFQCSLIVYKPIPRKVTKIKLKLKI